MSTDTGTTTIDPTVDAEAPRKGAMKRFAAAFYAKVKAAAKAVKDFIVRTLGDGSDPVIEKESLGRKFARIISAIPKWIALAAFGLSRLVLSVAAWAVVFIGMVVYVLMAVAVLAVQLLSRLVFLVLALVHKVVMGLVLIVRSPWLLSVSTEAFKADWKAYGLTWTPRHFISTSLDTVAINSMAADGWKAAAPARATEAPEALSQETVDQISRAVVETAMEAFGDADEAGNVTAEQLAAHEAALNDRLAQIPEIADELAASIERHPATGEAMIDGHRTYEGRHLVSIPGGKKGSPTPKQRKRRPARLPSPALSEA
jgi:hypothetical protein